MDEQRRAERYNTSHRAMILREESAQQIDCVVKDMSDTGAKIKVDAAVDLPAIFSLSIPKLDRTYQAEVRWRYAGSVGVKFQVSGKEPSAKEIYPTREALVIENHKLKCAIRSLHATLKAHGIQPTDTPYFRDAEQV